MQSRSVLAFLVLCSAAQAGEVESVTAQIPMERAQACSDGGGCSLVTKDEIEALTLRAFKAGERSGLAACMPKASWGI
jgi:hypothetical protein